jgi:hypothetical protein
MGLLRSLATPALTKQPQSQPQPQPQPIIRAPQAIYDPLGIPDDESSAISTQSSSLPPSSSSASSVPSSISNEFPYYTRFLQDDESSVISTQPSSSISSSSSSLSSLPSSVTSNFIREMRELLTGLGRGNAYDNLQYDPYGNEAIEDRFSDRSSLAAYYTADPTRAPTPLQPDRERSQAPSPAAQERSPTPPLPARQRSPTPPLPAQQRSQTPPPAQQQTDIPFAVDIYEELARDNPNISSVEEAAEILAADKDATAIDVQNLYKGKQSIFITAKSMGKKHGRSGKDMQGPYRNMPDYKNSWLVGRGERDAKIFKTIDADYVDEELYRNSFAKIKNSISQGTPTRQTRAKSRIEDMEAGSVEF